MTKILAVDDSPSLLQMVNYTLSTADYDVTNAEHGQQALDLAKESQFDVVVTDVNMPVMDGITLVAELRKLSNYRAVPILVLTTESSMNMKKAGKEAGATGWIVKPFNPEKLLKTISRVI